MTTLAGGNDARSVSFTTPTDEPVRHNLFYERVFSPVGLGHPLRHLGTPAKRR